MSHIDENSVRVATKSDVQFTKMSGQPVAGEIKTIRLSSAYPIAAEEANDFIKEHFPEFVDYNYYPQRGSNCHFGFCEKK